VIEKAKQFTGFFLTVAALVGAIYGIIRFIDFRIDAKLNDPSTTRRIALAVRPEMIIDQKGSILIDRGAMDYIADLKVTQNPKNPVVADTVTITPRRYMANPPLVTSVDAAFLHTSAEHGSKLDWIIKLEYNSWSEDGPNRLRIEIIDR
jgi:hypothetical protein